MTSSPHHHSNKAIFALVNRGCANLYLASDRFSECLTQAKLGESLRILSSKEKWFQVSLDSDGYVGWMQMKLLYPADAMEIHNYQAGFAMLVQSAFVPSYTDPRRSGKVCGHLPFGTAVPVIDHLDGMTALCLPDGRVWWVSSAGLLPISDRPRPDYDGIAHTIRLFHTFIGTPYLWGGTTPCGFDCSGLVQTFFGFMGLRLPRDADQQFLATKAVEGTPSPGDLLFFRSQTECSELISHVAISLGGDDFIHSSRAAGGVCLNSLHPCAQNYHPELRQCLVGIHHPNNNVLT